MTHRAIRSFIAAALLALLPCAALGDELTLPSGLAAVEEEAFMGCRTVTSLTLPEGVTALGDRAFYGCGALVRVKLPASLGEIGGEVFDQCGEALYFECEPGSDAAGWARRSGYDWSAGTVCRAFLVAQTYEDTDFALRGTVTDREAMFGCLSSFGGTAYAITSAENLSVTELLDGIADAFSGATQDDISLLYYSGHGEQGGYLLGGDLALLSPGRLRQALDAVPGRKVVVIDACYSGALITARSAGKSDEDAADQFVQSFARVFSQRSRGALSSGDYYVIVACGEEEESLEGYIYPGVPGARRMGYFTYSLCRGLGWDGVYSVANKLFADVNGDGVATIQEAFAFAYDRALAKNDGQHAVVYPENCTEFSPFRM